MAYLRLKLEPWLEAELERTARRENRRSLSDVAISMIKECVQNRRSADTSVDRLVAAIKGVTADVKSA